MISAVMAAFRRLSAKSVVKWRRRRPAALILLATFALAGCAVSPIGDTGSADPVAAKREAVTKRVQARWDALISGDFGTAYSLMSPASRESVTLEKFTAGLRKGAYRKIRIDRVECSGETCDVTLSLTYDHPMMKGLLATVEETWIFENGQPWYVLRN